MRWFNCCLMMCVAWCIAGADFGSPKRNAREPEIFTETEIRENMPSAPWYFVPPVTDRNFWKKYGGESAYLQRITRRAYGHLKKMPAAPTPEEYMKFYTDEKKYGRDYHTRLFAPYRSVLFDLLIGYCVSYDTESFLPAIQEMLKTYCEIPWTTPDFDRKQYAVKRAGFPLELVSTSTGAFLASAAYVLRPVLEPELYRKLQREIDLRIVSSFERLFVKPYYGEGWIRGAGGNWTAVCLGGITVALAAADIDPVRRAKLLTRCANHLDYYISGFNGEGYTSEGFDYWSYGHGYFLLADTLFLQASKGKINLIKRIPGACEATMYPYHILISDRIAPAYADCTIFAKCSPVVLDWCNYLLQDVPAAPVKLAHLNGHLIPVADSSRAEVRLPAVTEYKKAQVWILRPGEAENVRFGVSFKGGYNLEGHNHNDIGSYVVVQGKDGIIAVDPGAEVYNWRTFSKQRYESKLLNSYGHSVPVIDGKLQPESRNAKAAVVEKHLTGSAKDRVVLDLSKAYFVPGIRNLTRAFDYSRKGSGTFCVTDTFEFDVPKKFETAMVYLGKLSGLPGKSLTIEHNGEKMALSIENSGGEVEMFTEEIKENVRSKVKVFRLGIRFRKPVAKGAVRLTFTPMEK